MGDATKWQRLSEEFERASALNGEARDRFLAALASTDAALADSLRAMLAVDAEPHPLLDDAGASVRSLLESDATPPTHVGRYRIVRLLGEGGMGRVYLVEREEVGGHAALKVLRDAWISPERRARFASEQRVLAQLTHPGIAQLYEVGALTDGTPWFAMEYVEGTPITRHAETFELSVRERLALAAHVCRAVQHAHAHAVIHRDLKPSNVLVTADGRVKLLDFGIAKHLDATGEDDDRTRTGYRMLTPAYAAPEQFDGSPVGVRIDVHAIGVMLYELLTGASPWHEDAGTTTDPLLARRREITRPSALAARGVAAPGQATWRELDVLVQTAMHQDPERRYASVEALARDIAHYLANEPLEARPDSWRYRLDRLVRRRARELAAGAAVFAIVLSLSLWYTVGLARARDAARDEAARSARLQAFMLSLFSGGDEASGPADSLTVRTLVDRGAQEAGALDAEPEVRAELRETLGEIRRQLGAFAGSESLLVASLDERRALHGTRHVDVVRSLLALGRLRIDQARLPEADSLVQRARALADSLVAPTHPVAIEALAALGRTEQEGGRLPEAIAAQSEVLARLRSDTTTLEYAGALVELAGSHFYAGALDLSDTLNQRALAIYRARRGDAHPLVADVLINLGAGQFERGNYVEAERYDREALTRVRAWHGDAHPATASVLTLLGRALLFQSRDAAADTVLREALAVQERAYGNVHPRVASTLNELGTIALRSGRLNDAERFYRRNESIYTRLYEGRHWLIGIAQSNLGSVAMARKAYPTAERLYRLALVQFTDGQGPDHVNTAIAHVKLGRSLLRQERFHEAAESSRMGYDLLTARDAAPQGFIDAARTDLAQAYERLGDKAQARTFAAKPQ
ncbi:MAG: tetratricopeptide repeat protein [Gemmatimonadaceae bacterium]